VASTEAIQAHYDVSNDFYALWLDAETIYSCALWDPVSEDTLEAAQLRKIDYFAEALDLGSASRILDIGCGWGGLLRRVVQHGQAGEGVGLTLSPAQAGLAEQRTADLPITICIESWADHDRAKVYDAIVSIGAFEHFAPHGSGERERLATYERFFASAHRVLRPDGRFGLQTIALDDAVEEPGSSVGEFFTSTVFPESSVPRLSEVVRASEPWFAIEAVRVDASHYARTCREWRRRLLDRRADATELVGRDHVRQFSKYLLLSELQFTSRASTLCRLVLRRRGQPLGWLRASP